MVLVAMEVGVTDKEMELPYRRLHLMMEDHSAVHLNPTIRI